VQYQIHNVFTEASLQTVLACSDLPRHCRMQPDKHPLRNYIAIFLTLLPSSVINGNRLVSCFIHRHQWDTEFLLDWVSLDLLSCVTRFPPGSYRNVNGSIARNLVLSDPKDRKQKVRTHAPNLILLSFYLMSLSQRPRSFP
jgi:hypothetical protein